MPSKRPVIAVRPDDVTYLQILAAAAESNRTPGQFLLYHARKALADTPTTNRQRPTAIQQPQAAWANVAPQRPAPVAPVYEGPMWSDGKLEVPAASRMSEAKNAEFNRLWKEWRRQNPSGDNMRRWPWVAARLAQFVEPDEA